MVPEKYVRFDWTVKRLLRDKANFGVLFERDAMKTSRQEGMRKGMEKGLKKGLKKGKAEGKNEVVINMLKMNLDIDFIAQTTGLSAQEIVAIRKQLDRK